MTTISAVKAKEEFDQILSEVNKSSQPVIITNTNGENAVVLSENNWNAIQETLYLNSIPGMTESIIAGANTPIEECLSEDEVQW